MNFLIYQITNTVTDKIYIGQTSQSLSDRFYQHCKRSSGCKHLRYGKDNFKIELLVTCDNQMTANYLEHFWIEVYKSADRSLGYNISQGGTAPMLGRKHTDDTKQKLSVAMKGNKHLLGKGRLIFSSEQLCSIRNDNRANWKVAHDYSCSISTIRRIKLSLSPWSE